jgi:hypothetical protein
MLIRSFPLALGMTIGLASHRGWWIPPDQSGMKQLLDFFMDEVLPLNRLVLGLLVH